MSFLKNAIDVERGYTNRINCWIYGAPLSGKTTVAATFPKPLIISTDGNVKHVDPSIPAVRLSSTMNQLTPSGKKMPISGWEYFLGIIKELSLSNQYETIVVDLVEDMYELCRTHWNDAMGIIHESETKQGMGSKTIKTSFFQALSDLQNLSQNVVLISHAKNDSWGKVEVVRTNIAESIENKIRGYTDGLLYLHSEVDAETGKIVRALVLNSNSPIANTRWDTEVNVTDPSYEGIINAITNKVKIKKEKK